MIPRFVAFCLHRRWLMLAVFMGISCFGFYALKQLAIEAYPDIGDVTAQVITSYPGHASEEVEQQITIGVSECIRMTSAGSRQGAMRL